MPDSLRISLTSGATIEVMSVFLCEETSLLAAASLRAQAASALGTSLSGVGVIGSPSWALMGGLALGLLESLAASSATRTAAEHLKEAARLESAARADGHFLPVESIDGSTRPSPNLWRATGPLSPKGNRRFYIHDGGAFLQVRDRAGTEQWLALDKIESYQPLFA